MEIPFVVRHGELLSLGGFKVIIAVGVQREYHLPAGFSAVRYLRENERLQLFSAGETECAVHEIHLIIYYDKSFHKYLTFSCGGRSCPSFR